MATFEQVKLANPRMRRRAPCGIVVNTSRRRVVECCLCGARISCCSDYPETVRVKEFRDYHDAGRCQRA